MENVISDDVIRTMGVDHVGLAVRDLAASEKFFTHCLGWTLLGGNADYPAAFVGDGPTRITLWQVEDPGTACSAHYPAICRPWRARSFPLR